MKAVRAHGAPSRSADGNKSGEGEDAVEVVPEEADAATEDSSASSYRTADECFSEVDASLQPSLE